MVKRLLRRLGWMGAVTAVAIIGVVVGLYVGGTVKTDIGPFNAELSVGPSLSGGSTVAIPPLGALTLDSHDGPTHLSLRLGSIDVQKAKKAVFEPDGITKASDSAAADVQAGLVRVLLQASGVSLLAALGLGALVFRNMRRVAATGLAALVVIVLGLGTAAATFRGDSIAQPKYEGLLVNAPAVVGDARKIANRYDEYTAQLQRLVRNVSKLYTTVSKLPVYEPDAETTRVLHVSDLHLNPAAWSLINTVVEQFNIDVVVDTGDINDWGSEQEAAYVSAIAALKVPYVYIRGNHDSAVTAAAVAKAPNATVLENTTTTVHGLTFAGIGDPRFSPDKSSDPDTKSDPRAAAYVSNELTRTGQRLADTVRRSPTKVDIALIHDPAAAPPLAGTCPVVLAGHTHHREVRDLGDKPGAAKPGPTATPTPPPANGPAATRLMVAGSTGGAGLRGLDGDKPTPLGLSVLYFNRDRALQAYDDISVGGTGESGVTLQRHVVNGR